MRYVIYERRLLLNVITVDFSNQVVISDLWCFVSTGLSVAFLLVILFSQFLGSCCNYFRWPSVLTHCSFLPWSVQETATFLSFFIHCAVVFHCFLLSFFSREFRTESRNFLSERFKPFCARCWNCFTTCRFLQRYKLSSSKRNYVNSWMWRWSGSDVTCKKSHSIAKNIFGLKGAQKKNNNSSLWKKDPLKYSNNASIMYKT